MSIPVCLWLWLCLCSNLLLGHFRVHVCEPASLQLRTAYLYTKNIKLAYTVLIRSSVSYKSLSSPKTRHTDLASTQTTRTCRPNATIIWRFVFSLISGAFPPLTGVGGRRYVPADWTLGSGGGADTFSLNGMKRMQSHCVLSKNNVHIYANMAVYGEFGLVCISKVHKRYKLVCIP